MKLMVPVLVQIQRQREIANQIFLDTPVNRSALRAMENWTTAPLK
ncbi:MAG: hypothetical protein WCE49_14445 [Terrimicrobiaceae bacterium]